MAPSLELCMEVRGYISAGKKIGQIKNVLGGATRLYVPVDSGHIKGTGPAAGLSAEISAASSDAALLNPLTNNVHLNVRIGAHTPDGETIFVEYQGVLKLDEAGQKVFAGAEDAKTTEYGAQEWFTTPRIETSSEKFKWMEDTVWVGQGHYVVDEVGSAVEYQVYRVVN